MFVRTPDGWVSAPRAHLPMVAAPFADFTWRYARRLTAEAGLDDTNETVVATVLDALLTRAQAGPADAGDALVDVTGSRIAARTRLGAAAHRPPVLEPADPQSSEPPGPVEAAEEPGDALTGVVVPLGIFDVEAEAERWI